MNRKAADSIKLRNIYKNDNDKQEIENLKKLVRNTNFNLGNSE